MPLDLSNTLVIGISSRALFDLEKENEIFEKEGLTAYQKYQVEHEDIQLEKGTAFHLIKSLLKLNETRRDRKLIEVVIMSRNSPDTGLRILNSIKYYNLPISRSAFTSSVSLANYVDAFDVDLFLSKSESDIQDVIDSGKCAAALIYSPPDGFKPDDNTLRIAFDADAVIFSDESEQIYKKQGLTEFQKNESNNENIPLKEGPFGKFIKLLSKIQRDIDKNLMRIAIVTARDYPANIRVIKTLRSWGVYVDEAFFLGGISKDKVLKSFNAHIFFDDQDAHVVPASVLVPSSRVPYKKTSPLYVATKHLTVVKEE
ncbi:MAG: 5'-nucleotidase [Marinilabiliaceae bacterium]|nr:5'-nucleotidase [Marinilabiliaceae bacterium]